jgi:hypothetical protein
VLEVLSVPGGKSGVPGLWALAVLEQQRACGCSDGSADCPAPHLGSDNYQELSISPRGDI